MDFKFGSIYYVMDNHRNVKQYVSIATQNDFVLGVQFRESPKYTLLQFLSDLCEDSKEYGYAGIAIHYKGDCFSTHEEADRNEKNDKGRERTDG